MGIIYAGQIRRLGASLPSLTTLYSHADSDDSFTMNAVNEGYAQLFSGDGSALHSATWKFGLNTAPVGTIVAKLYATSAGAPTGAALATSNSIDASTVATGATQLFSFAPTYVLVNGTTYAVSVEFSAYTSGSMAISIDGAGTNGAYNDGSWTADAGNGAYATINGVN